MIQKRLQILLVAGAGMFSLLSARIVHLQVFKGNDFARQAFHAHFRRIPVLPRRAAIWDRAGRLMAVSLETDSLCADPARVADPVTAASLLSEILPISAGELTSRLSRKNRRFVWLHRGITPAIAERVQAARIGGVFFKREFQRFYPTSDMMASVLGFCGMDGRGLEGLESTLDRRLAGLPGEELQAFDALSRPYSGDSVILREPQQGEDVHVTLDAAVQYFVSVELKRILQQENARWGAAVVMDVHTGDVLAMVTEPSFNPHLFSLTTPESRRNRCATQLVEPGSTFKAVTLASAIDAGTVQLSETIDCENGRFQVGSTVFSDWKAFSNLSVEDVIAYSSNIGTIKIAHRVGGTALADFSARLGIGSLTVPGLPGAEAGYIRSPATWTDTATASLSIGYGVALSPLQLARVYAAFANGGYRVDPQIIRSSSRSPSIRIMDPATADQVSRALTAAVARGTGKRAGPARYSAAGKTGTARRYDHASGRYDENRVTCVFTGFAPAEHPRVSVCVIIDDPGHHKWASEVSASVFARIVNRTLLYLGESPQRKAAA
ncbi:penicillin-binding protein 2 [bacterium]|nr:penicillin-binding protein 2 [candidate division CSSED10-310 bacterium]